MLRILVHVSAALSCACLLDGCISLGLHDTARTAPPGQFEYGGIVDLSCAPAEEDVPAQAWPWPGLYARVGLSDKSDLGLRWTFDPGIGVDGKYRLASGGVDVAVRLGASAHYYPYGLFLFEMTSDDVGLFSLSPRVIVSSEPESGLPWTVNAGVDYNGAFGRYGSGVLNLRAGAGLPFLAGSTRITPEVGVSLPLSTDSDHFEGAPGFSDQAVMTLGVSVGSVAAAEDEGRWSPGD